MIIPPIADIVSRLERIVENPSSAKVFGAKSRLSGHGFAFGKIHPAELTQFEISLGVDLPRDYLEVLTLIGAGAGPYYGLFTPSAVLEELSNINFDPADGITPANPAKTFPISSHDLSQLKARLSAGSDPTHILTSWPCNGCIPICFHGCTFWTALVTAGEFAGTVWDVACFEGSNGQFFPAIRPPGILGLDPQLALPDLPEPPNFLDWYRAWLERMESDRSRYRPPTWQDSLKSKFGW